DTRTAVDVTHYHMVGVLFPEFLEKRWRTTIAERTTSMQVRNHNLSAWVEDLGRLRHEVHTGENDHVCVSLFSLLRQAKAITDVVSHILYVWLLVVVGEYNCILFLLQPLDLSKEIKCGIQFNVQVTFLWYILCSG